MKKYRYWLLAALFLTVETIILLILGEDIYASAHDNLELHVLDYHLLRENGLFFSHGTQLPVLNGVSRDYFFSEFNIYSILFMLFPSCYAYISGLILKTAVALFSVRLLAKDVLKNRYEQYEPLVVLTGLAYGLLPLYPMFAIYFTSIPYLIWLLRRIFADEGKIYYLLLFTYPFLSYFTFFGMFILGYMVLVMLYFLFRRSKNALKMLVCVFILAAGYIVFEYRLFYTMLFSGTVTIRDAMVFESFNAEEFFLAVADVFRNGIFHAESVHGYLVMPVVLLYLAVTLIREMREKKSVKLFFKNPVFLILSVIIFNCLIYGIYYIEPVRDFVEFVLPPAKGLQFNRTVYFNPLLWYMAFFMVLKQLYDTGFVKFSNVLASFAVIIVLLSDTKYNDLFQTAYNYAYRIVRREESNNLSYREFYSTELFDEIKAEIAYDNEKSVAYGFDPGILSYNGIYTLDGVLSYYPLSYKEEFRKIIAPAIDRPGNEAAKAYYDDWGARAYLVSGSGESVSQALRNYEIKDRKLYIDTEAFKELGGRYIFSRFEPDNADELGISLIGKYFKEGLPYTIYTYEVLE